MSDAQQDKGSSELIDNLGCLAVLAGLAAIVFLFLGIQTQRRIVFETFGYPSGPDGNYSPMQVLSSTVESGSWSADSYVVTAKRSASSIPQVDPNDPLGISNSTESEDGLALGIVYTVECAPHFWNLCAGLTPGQKYYARWTSSEHKQIAIAELQTDGKYIDPKKVRIFEVRGWKKTEE
jgi:hypothetical protein